MLSLTTVSPILQMRKPRQREVIYSQYHQLLNDGAGIQSIYKGSVDPPHA